MPRDLAEYFESLVERDGIWMAPQDREISYPQHGNDACFDVEDSSFWFRHRNQIIEHLVKIWSPERTFFDIGGGNGCVSYYLQQSGIDVVLVEPGASGAMNAVDRGVRTVVQSTLEDASFFQGSIQTAGLFDVLEHIEDDEQFLRSLHDYLAPGGLLYITVPAFQLLWSAEDDHAGHFRRYTLPSLKDRLNRCGFSIEYGSYLFSFLYPAILLARSLPNKIGLRKSVNHDTTIKEHSERGGLAGTLVNECLEYELNRIRNQKYIPIGSSCLAVASKKVD